MNGFESLPHVGLMLVMCVCMMLVVGKQWPADVGRVMVVISALFSCAMLLRLTMLVLRELS